MVLTVFLESEEPLSPALPIEECTSCDIMPQNMDIAADEVNIQEENDESDFTTQIDESSSSGSVNSVKVLLS